MRVHPASDAVGEPAESCDRHRNGTSGPVLGTPNYYATCVQGHYQAVDLRIPSEFLLDVFRLLHPVGHGLLWLRQH